jgi:hypothetical protein
VEAGRVRDSFVGSMARAGGEPERGLRLRLVFDPSAPGMLPLAALPWELLYYPDTRDFFARNRQTPVVRFLDVPRFTVPTPVEPPLRILVARANPEGAHPLDLGTRRLVVVQWTPDGREQVVGHIPIWDDDVIAALRHVEALLRSSEALAQLLGAGCGPVAELLDRRLMEG